MIVHTLHKMIAGALLLCAALGVACAGESSGSGGGNSNGSGTAGSGAGASAGTAGISSSGMVDGGSSSAAGSGAGTGSLPEPSLEPVSIDACPGSVSAANVAALQDPGVQTVAPMRWLYPYDHTVMPRGLEAPLLQWDEVSGASEAVYLHLKSGLFEYKGCLPPKKAGQVQIPQDVWEMAGAQSKGAADPLTIELVAIAGGAASKLPSRKLVFALALLKNDIYYNTYGSALANQLAIVGGVVMRITPSKPTPDVFLKAQNTALNCIGCHAVSADGSKLVAEEHALPGLTEAIGGIYDLSSVGAGTFPSPIVSLKRAGFSALYPDGSVYLTTGRPQAGPLGGTGNVTGTFGPEVSKLIDAATGSEIAGTDAPAYALMPMFATDGKLIVFNHLSDAGAGGHALATMSFDRTTNKFSALKSLYTHATLYPGWPAFLPEVAQTSDELTPTTGRRVVFALGTNADYVTQSVGVPGPHNSDLWWADVESGQAATLGRAGGFDGATNFMPYAERDAHRDFMPTVSPVAAGGYFWLFFSSRRQYGNELVYPDESAAEAKKIWVAAIDANAAPGSDPSHPAFYLPGQESASGNVRAFAALSPCKVDGESCETGIDCCSGFCIDGKCGAPPQRCSELDEKCETTADCCEGKGLSCVGGFCGYIVPE
jgi:hypothetical protein